MKKTKKIMGITSVFILLFTLTINAFALDGKVEAKVALLHFSPVLGDTNTNLARLKLLISQAFDNHANLVVTPELATTGYCITRQQAIDGLAFTSPYPQLNDIRDLAIAHNGYVVIAIAELAAGGKVFNTAVIFGPEGFIRTQDKRSLPLWHNRGVLPFEVVPTPFGDLGVLVCADSYLQDWTRILTLKGADIIVTPANWWGHYDQEQTWQIRAKENGIWFFTANRWGLEIDNRYNPPYTYNMNDAPSAVINPEGKLLQIYRTEDDPNPRDMILYQTITVPKYRIGSAFNPIYSLKERRPSAYGEIANSYYRGDLGYQPAPGLPVPDDIRVAALAYKPSISAVENLNTINTLWAQQTTGADVVVLPGFGITFAAVSSSQPEWYMLEPWSRLQSFVEFNRLALLVTTVNEVTDGTINYSLLIMQAGKSPRLVRQIHDGLYTKGSGNQPLVLDLLCARIGILTGHDLLFPETATQLTKSGVDLVLAPSTVGTTYETVDLVSQGYLWAVPMLKTLWKVRTNEAFHLAVSDWTGNGMIVKSMSYEIEEVKELDSSNPVAVLTLNTGNVRDKYLNAYYSFDLETLLGNYTMSDLALTSILQGMYR